jgi:hypothetical protein
MKNRNLVFSLALSVPVIVAAITSNVNHSTAQPGLHGPNLRADGIPLPPPPKPKPTGTLSADGIPLPPPPKPKPTGTLTADGIPLPPPAQAEIDREVSRYVHQGTCLRRPAIGNHNGWSVSRFIYYRVIYCDRLSRNG